MGRSKPCGMGSYLEKMEPCGMGSHPENMEPCDMYGKPPEKMEPPGMGIHPEKTDQATQVKTAFLSICTEPAQEDLASKINFNSSGAIVTSRTAGAVPDAACSARVHEGTTLGCSLSQSRELPGRVRNKAEYPSFVSPGKYHRDLRSGVLHLGPRCSYLQLLF